MLSCLQPVHLTVMLSLYGLTFTKLIDIRFLGQLCQHLLQIIKCNSPKSPSCSLTDASILS